MRRGGLRAAILAGALALPACGPIEYIATVPADANGALAEAKHLNAEKYAPYEITAANEYINKSRMLAGYARFHSSVTFGSKAADNARKAKRISIEKAALPEERNERTHLPAAVEMAPSTGTPVVTIEPVTPTPTPTPAPIAPVSAPQPTSITIIHTDQPSAPPAPVEIQAK